jgi:hypothetical protein
MEFKVIACILLRLCWLLRGGRADDGVEDTHVTQKLLLIAQQAPWREHSRRHPKSVIPGAKVSSQGDAAVLSRSASLVSARRRCAAFALLLFAAGCSRPSTPTAETPSSGDWHTFQGTWSASGTRQTLNFEANHRASVFDLTGTLLLTGDRGLGVGFQSQAIGLTDSLTGMQGRCVWTDDRGEKVFSELKGEFVATGNHIVGKFLGGTGRFAGVTGEYSFQWQYVVESEDGTVSGRAIDLKGRVRWGSAAAAHDGEHSQ